MSYSEVGADEVYEAHWQEKVGLDKVLRITQSSSKKSELSKAQVIKKYKGTFSK